MISIVNREAPENLKNYILRTPTIWEVNSSKRDMDLNYLYISKNGHGSTANITKEAVIYPRIETMSEVGTTQI